ncbi:MAG: M23 family metallopeptidase [Deltaproteobacteria bacterium]|nr:M23 family metallopeptidase [Deltaproteobacteria bacterium]
MRKGAWILVAGFALAALVVAVHVSPNTARGVGNLEAVHLDEVAPDEREQRADDRAPAGGALPPELTTEDGGRRDLGELAEELRQMWRTIPAYSPVNGTSWLTSGFGWRASPFTGRREFHGGIDLAGPRGTPIVAPADGVVERVLQDDASGRVVVLNHGNGMETLYGHLDEVSVAVGQEVVRGQRLGALGSSGWRSTGPHLHYGVKLARKYVNPRRYLFEKERASR